jgi:bifunctional non-homologous end joining protein LigD
VFVEITYLTWTEDNFLRQASYQGQREDKPAPQVVRRVPPASVPAVKSRAARGTV